MPSRSWSNPLVMVIDSSAKAPPDCFAIESRRCSCATGCRRSAHPKTNVTIGSNASHSIGLRMSKPPCRRQTCITATNSVRRSPAGVPAQPHCGADRTSVPLSMHFAGKAHCDYLWPDPDFLVVHVERTPGLGDGRVVHAHVALRHLDGRVAEDLLNDLQRHAR
jgi:hypothetical protein